MTDYPHAEVKLIREDWKRRYPKSLNAFGQPDLSRGGPAHRNPEDVAVEMVLAERALADEVMKSLIAGYEKRIADLRMAMEKESIKPEERIDMSSEIRGLPNNPK